MGSAQAFRNVARIIDNCHANQQDVVPVLSAMYGITDHLVESVALAQKAEMDGVRAQRERVMSLHEETVYDLFPNAGGARDDTMEFIQSSMNEHYDNVLEAISTRGYAQDNEVDRVVSMGERLSSRVMAAFLTSIDIPAAFIPTDKLIVTDGVPSNSMPLLEPTAARVSQTVEPLLENGVTPVVTGFFGAGEDGQLTTFGRGGSDLTAAVMGYCLNANDISLFKVEYSKREDGFLDQWKPGWEGVVHDADPRLTIENLSYEAAAQLAHFGKKVLHPATVYPAVEKGIPISVKNTLNFMNEGTRIRSERDLSQDDQAVLALTKMEVSEYEQKTKNQVELDWEASPVPREDALLVVMVGNSVMEQARDVLSDVEASLTKAGVPFTVPDRVNGSEHHLSLVVPQERKKDALKALHREFFPNTLEQVEEQ